MKWWLIGFLMLPWAPAAAATGAQKDEGEEQICLTIGHRWSGTLNETRDIRAAPIAPSFRAVMDAGGCARFQLIKETLIDWHIAFGDEQSTAAALMYLQTELLRDLPQPSLYAAALQEARQAAKPNTGRSQKGARNRRRFEQLSTADYEYRRIAQTALAAAEEFGSLAFLDRAEAAIRALQGRVVVLGAADTTEAEASNLAGDAARVTELRMRAAVLRADLTRSEADIKLAETLVQSAEQPLFRTAAEVAYSAGESFCDIAEGYGSKAEAVEQACRDDDLLEERVIGYWRNRAMLDLVMGAPENGSDELALRLLDQRDRRCCGLRISGDLFRLQLMLSDRHRRAFANPALAGKTDRYEEWQQALDHLERALRMAPPSEAPARFRRVAERWLAMWDQSGVALESTGGGGLPASLHRYATYLRRILPQLDAIAAGAE
ncbi:MAG TPA: hypothetical protein VGB65_06820 [Allosphingosinicella sp.]